MKTTRNVRIGRICKKHPGTNGLRYVGNNNCVECAKEHSRKHYASLEMTPAQKITTLLAEISKLKAENEALRKLTVELRGSAECHNVHHCKDEYHELGDHCKVLARIDASMGKGERP